jgi:xanthine dehydrogenase accessory factor
MIARAAHALQWLDEGRRVAAVTLVEVNGSAPMDLGATMLVDGDGTVDGSVTGGCVEAALAETALDVLNGGCPELVSHGISDDDASEVGLMCGGTVRLFVHALRNREIPTLQAIVGAAESGQDVALATLVVGPDPGRMLAVANGVVVGSLGGAPTLDNTVESDLRRALQTGESSLRQHHVSGALGSEVDVFVESVVSPAAMIIVGAGDHSAAVAALAPALGYRPVICDPRSAFMRSGHLRSVAELVTGWPDRYLDSQALTERDVVLVFTHDPKLD